MSKTARGTKRVYSEPVSNEEAFQQALKDIRASLAERKDGDPSQGLSLLKMNPQKAVRDYFQPIATIISI